MDCIEAANFAGQPQSEIDRLLSFVSLRAIATLVDPH